MNHDWIQEAAREIVEEYPIYGENAVAEVAAIISRLSGTEQSDLAITTEQLEGLGWEPIACPCCEGEHEGGESMYVLSYPGIRSRPIRPCVGHLDGYLKAGWFARALSPTSDAKENG